MLMCITDDVYIYETMISREFGLVLRQEVMAVIDVWVMTWGGILDMTISSRYTALVLSYTLNLKIGFRPKNCRCIVVQRVVWT